MDTTTFPDFELPTIKPGELADLKPVGIFYNEYMTTFGMKMTNGEIKVCGARGEY